MPFRRHAVEALVVAIATGTYAAALLIACAGFQPGADSHYHFLVARDIARAPSSPTWRAVCRSRYCAKCPSITIGDTI